MSSIIFDNKVFVVLIAVLFLFLGIKQLSRAKKNPEKINSTSGDDNSFIVVTTGIGCIVLSVEFILISFFDFSVIKWILRLYN